MPLNKDITGWEWACGLGTLRFQMREPLAKMLPWDGLQIWLETPTDRVLLFDDIAREALSALNERLPELLAGKAPLPVAWQERGLGYHFSALEGALIWADDMETLVSPDPTAGHWLWSRPVHANGGLQTWLYNQGTAIWLEVSPGSYGLEYRDAHPDHSLEDYLAQYGPVWRCELAPDQAQTWLAASETLLAEMESHLTASS